MGAPDGLLITIPDHDQISSRAITLSADILAPPVWIMPIDVTPDAAVIAVNAAPTERPPRAADPAPRVLDHIIRTSRALII